MKISKDQNTITLDDGRVFKAVVGGFFSLCNRCDFGGKHCWIAPCCTSERIDHKQVFFKEVKNEQKNR